jgi:hypothetical protein
MKGHLVNPYATAAVASMDYHKSYQHLLHLSGHDLMNHHHHQQQQQQQQQILQQQHQAESAAVSVSSSPPVNVSVRSDTPNDNNTNNGDGKVSSSFILLVAKKNSFFFSSGVHHHLCFFLVVYFFSPLSQRCSRGEIRVVVGKSHKNTRERERESLWPRGNLLFQATGCVCCAVCIGEDLLPPSRRILRREKSLWYSPERVTGGR